MASIFNDLEKEIENGLLGKNQSIPIGLDRLGKYANIRKRIFTLLFSGTGAGKSALLDTILLNSCFQYMERPSDAKLRPDFQLFSMERASILRVAKWTCFRVFKEYGEVIQLPKMLGWWDEKLTNAEKDLVLKQKEFFDCLLNDYVTIHDGAKSPKEIFKIMKDHFESKGRYEELGMIDAKTGKERIRKIYVANDEKDVIVPVLDHGNLIKTSKEYPDKKSAIDKTVEFMQGFRDLEGASPFWIAQVNRSITGVTRIKDSEHELTLDDVKQSGDVGDACDIAISLFDPLRYNQSSKTGYNPSDFLDKRDGSNYFRSCQILKSSYGQDNLRIPMAFNGFCGQFKELPRRSDVLDNELHTLISQVLSKEYFMS